MLDSVEVAQFLETWTTLKLRKTEANATQLESRADIRLIFSGMRHAHFLSNVYSWLDLQLVE